MLTQKVLTGIVQKLPGLTFSVRRMEKLWTPKEAERFEQELEYLTEKYSLEKVVDGYVYLTDVTIRASKYFQEHGEYQYHSFAEVNENVYADQGKMTLCMLGLSLSEYLWETVLRIHRFYEEQIGEASGENYLEIGPGHGKYFCEAYNLGKFRKYVAVDVSPTAIAMTKDYINKRRMRGGIRTSLPGCHAA